MTCPYTFDLGMILTLDLDVFSVKIQLDRNDRSAPIYEGFLNRKKYNICLKFHASL